MKPRLYIETTIPSYLTAWLSRDLVMAGHQQTTREWWESRRQDFDLFVSQFVIDEARGGDLDAARRRLESLEGIPLLAIGQAGYALAEDLINNLPLPAKAAADALHIAVAAVNGIDYLLTWNCTHIANAVNRDRIEEICRNHGYEPPIICTPEELLSES